MKLVGSFAVIVAAFMLGGCGAQSRAKAPSDVFEAMDAELSRAVSTTTVTSAPVAPRLGPAAWEDFDDDDAAVQTWGVQDDPYGF